MRTDVKIGIASGAIILIIAGSYYGTKKRPDIQLADSGDAIREQNARTLQELLSSEPQTAQAENQPAKDPGEEEPQPRKVTPQQPQVREHGVSKPESPAVDAELVQRTLQASKGLPPVRPTTERSSPWQSPQATERPRGRTGLARAGKVPERPPTAASSTRDRGTAGGQNPNGPPAPRRQKTPIRSASSAKQAARTHVIQPGDNFSLLAQRYYGSQKHTTFLVNANRNIDPRRMKVGSRLRIPPLMAGEAQVAPMQPAVRKSGERLREVREGDSLYAIAEDSLGSGDRWREVYELNKARIGNDPSALRVGLILKLPPR